MSVHSSEDMTDWPADPAQDTVEHPSKLYASLFDDARLSDITIKCGQTEVKVHKIVLARASEYFHKLLLDTFSEAASGHRTIELHDDDPQAVYDMLCFIYGKPKPIRRGVPTGWDSLPIRDLLPPVQQYIVADKYGIQSLKDTARNEISNIIEWQAGAMSDTELYPVLYKLFSETPEQDKIRAAVASALVEHLEFCVRADGFQALLLDFPTMALEVIKAQSSRMKCYRCGKVVRQGACGPCEAYKRGTWSPRGATAWPTEPTGWSA